MKKKIYLFYKSLLCLFFLLNLSVSYAQNLQWQKCYGGLGSEWGDVILSTPDGGYILAGSAASADNGDVTGNHGLSGFPDFWVVKVDSLGVLQWQKSLGGNGEEICYDMAATADGGYILTGYTMSNSGDVYGNHGLSDVWVVKITSLGNLQWQVCLGGVLHEKGNSIRQTADGGYILTGSAFSNDGNVTANHGGSTNTADVWVVKLDAVGTLEWQKCYGGTLNDVGNSIIPTADGGYILTGYALSHNGDINLIIHGTPAELWIIKLDSVGTIQWQKILGGTSHDTGIEIQSTPDGGYILVGESGSNDGDVNATHTSIDIWLMKLDSLANFQWKRTFGGTNTESVASLKQTTDGGYLLAASTGSNNTGDVTGYYAGNASSISDAWVAKVSSTGNLLWQKTLGGTYTDGAAYVSLAPNGGYMIIGTTFSTDGTISGNHGNSDMWLMKLKEVCANENMFIDLGTDTTVCTGTNAVFNATPTNGVAPFSYGWSPVSNTNAILTVNVTVPTNFSVWARDTNNCMAYDTVHAAVAASPNTPTITQNGQTLVCSTLGVSYQWLLSGVPISGATIQTYVPTQNGLYAVKVTNTAGCSKTSLPKYVANVKIEDAFFADLSIYPNPVNKQLFISWEQAIEKPVQMSLIEANGRILYSKELTLMGQNGNIGIEMESLAAGVYFLQILSGEHSFITKVIKE